MYILKNGLANEQIRQRYEYSVCVCVCVCVCVYRAWMRNPQTLILTTNPVAGKRHQPLPGGGRVLWRAGAHQRPQAPRESEDPLHSLLHPPNLLSSHKDSTKRGTERGTERSTERSCRPCRGACSGQGADTHTSDPRTLEHKDTATHRDTTADADADAATSTDTAAGRDTARGTWAGGGRGRRQLSAIIAEHGVGCIRGFDNLRLSGKQRERGC